MDNNNDRNNKNNKNGRSGLVPVLVAILAVLVILTVTCFVIFAIKDRQGGCSGNQGDTSQTSESENEESSISPSSEETESGEETSETGEKKTSEETSETGEKKTSEETSETSEKKTSEETTETAETTTHREYDSVIEQYLYENVTDTDQMMIVVGDDSWTGVTFYFYEKTSGDADSDDTDAEDIFAGDADSDDTNSKTADTEDEGEWELLLECPASIGENGFSDHTYEGDRTTPTGRFNIGIAFGNYDNPGTALEWVDVNEYLYWVDDVTSQYYEQLIDSREVPDGWNSGEHLIEFGDYYGYSIHIKVNPPYTTSAIFLHCTQGYGTTGGCVGIEWYDLEEVLQNVRSTAEITIVADESDLLELKTIS